MKRWIAMAAALAVSTVGLSVSVGTPARAAECSPQSAAVETDPNAGTDPLPEMDPCLDFNRAAAATPPRRDGYKTLILLHGFNKGGSVNCNDYWGDGEVKRYLNNTRGWAGKVKMLTYYRSGGTGCTRIPGAAGTNRRIDDLGADFAWYVYNNYSRSGVAVDVIAHSMGGLVTRVAIAGTQRRLTTGSGRTFPPYLYIEDVATLSTPHEGARGWVRAACDPSRRLQACQMRPGDSWLRSWINPYPNPQSRMGTDWSLIGSGADWVVNSGSGLNKAARQWGHKYLYNSSSGLDHGQMANITENGRGFRYPIEYCHYNASCVMTEPSERNRWPRIARGAGPLWVAANAVYYRSSW